MIELPRSEVAVECNVCSMRRGTTRIGATVVTRPADLDEAEVALLDAIAALPAPADRGPATPDRALAPGSSLTGRRLDVLLDAQLASRFLDHAARWLRAEGHGFYTIGSAGHEANALVAAALRPTDPALLHYRSGGFYLARAQQVADHDGVGDILRGLLAASRRADRRRPPQGVRTPRPRGDPADVDDRVAPAAGPRRGVRDRPRRRASARRSPGPTDAVAVCTFRRRLAQPLDGPGRAQRGGVTARTAGWPLPLLFVCEDNGLGHQRADAGRVGGRRWPGCPACGTSTSTAPTRSAVFDATEELAEHVPRARPSRRSCTCARVRYGGHAGSDVEAAYRDPARSCGPTASSTRSSRPAAVLVGAGLATPDELVRRALALAPRRAGRRRGADRRPAGSPRPTR